MTLPRLPLIAVILAFLFVLRLLLPFSADPDVWWHLKTGQAFVEQGSLHFPDAFAYTSSPTAGVLAEWLAQLVFYGAHALGGFLALELLVASVLTLYCWLTYRNCQRLLRGDEGKAILVTLACGLLASISAARPHLFTFLLFAVLLSLLLDFKYAGRTRHFWLLPPIFLLWANLHGGYFIGLALLALFLASEWLQHYWRRAHALPKDGLRRLTLWAGLGFLATAVNPHHVHYWLYPFEMLFVSSDMQNIQEWLSPDFHEPLMLYFLLLVFLFFMALLHARRRFDLTEILVPGMFIAAAFISRRNIPLAALAIAPFLALALHERDYLRQEQHAATRQLGSVENRLNWLLLLMATLMLALGLPKMQAQSEKIHTALVPVAAADFIEQHHIQGRMFNTHHYGGYLIYRFAPQRQVFLFGRHDVFPAGFTRDYFAMYGGASNWRQLLDKYAIDYLLIENQAPLRQLLLAGHDYRLVYEDKHNSVLLRDSPAFHDLIARYGREPSLPAARPAGH